MSQTHKLNSYSITFKTAIAGTFYRKLAANPQDKFASYREIAEYLEDLAQEIRRSGNICYVISDRYRNENVFSDVSDIIAQEGNGMRLLDGRNIEDVVEKFFGAIPIPVISCMETIDERYNAELLPNEEDELSKALLII